MSKRDVRTYYKEVYDARRYRILAIVYLLMALGVVVYGACLVIAPAPIFVNAPYVLIVPAGLALWLLWSAKDRWRKMQEINKRHAWWQHR